jgi:hypothetical protein
MAFLDEMQALARVALRDWDLEVANLAPIKVRENAVFRLDLAGGGRAVLRVHRSGYHSDAELRSEFAWMRALEEDGIPVPRVIRSRHGRDFEVIAMPMIDDPRQVDVFEWIDGRQMGSVESGISGDESAVAEQYYMIGAMPGTPRGCSASSRSGDVFGSSRRSRRLKEVCSCALVRALRASSKPMARNPIATGSFMPISSRRICWSTDAACR